MSTNSPSVSSASGWPHCLGRPDRSRVLCLKSAGLTGLSPLVRGMFLPRVGAVLGVSRRGTFAVSTLGSDPAFHARSRWGAACQSPCRAENQEGKVLRCKRRQFQLLFSAHQLAAATARVRSRADREFDAQEYKPTLKEESTKDCMVGRQALKGEGKCSTKSACIGCRSEGVRAF